MYELAHKLGELLRQQGLTAATAESCTGGWVSQAITSVPGSSDWYDRGFVTYSNAAKQEMLGVSEQSLQRFGAVSEQVAREMADGALRHSGAAISVAVTGIAGPDGGSEDKPVGTVWLAWALQNTETRTLVRHFQGDREEVRRQAVKIALQGMIERVTGD